MASSVRKDAKQEVRRAGRGARRGARRANREARRAAANPWLQFVTRWGYVVRGVLYGVMGLLGLAVATGLAGHGTDQRGALLLLIGNPFAKLVLALIAAGLLPYSLWGVVRALYDPFGRGDDPPGIAARLGYAWSAFAYAALLLVVLQLLFGADPSAMRGDSVQSTVGHALAAPLGVLLTGLAGVIGVAAGFGQFVDAYRGGFASDLEKRDMTRDEEKAALWVGRYGLVARGVIFTLTGWFVLQAAIHNDAAQAHGFGAAFDKIEQAPFGALLVGLVGLGFVALAVHSLIYARWARMVER